MKTDPKTFSITEIGLRDKQIVAFLKAGIHTLGDFTELTAQQLVRHGIKGRRLGVVRNTLRTHGLNLKGETLEPCEKVADHHAAPPKSRAKLEVPEHDEEVEIDIESVADARKRSAQALLGLDYELYERMRKGDPFARNVQVCQNLRLAYSFIWKHPWRSFVADPEIDASMEFDDYMQELFMGLMRATDKFDPSMGFRYSTYAWQWLRQAMTRALMNAGTIRIPVHVHEGMQKYMRAERKLRQKLPKETEISPEMVAAAAGIEENMLALILFVFGHYPDRRKIARLNNPRYNDGDGDLGMEMVDYVSTDSPADAFVGWDTVYDSAFEHVHDYMERMDARTTVNRLLNSGRFNEREIKILTKRFGLDYQGEHTLEEVGEELGVTRERIRQIEAKAMQKLCDPDLWEDVLAGHNPRDTEDTAELADSMADAKDKLDTWRLRVQTGKGKHPDREDARNGLMQVLLSGEFDDKVTRIIVYSYNLDTLGRRDTATIAAHVEMTQESILAAEQAATERLYDPALIKKILGWTVTEVATTTVVPTRVPTRTQPQPHEQVDVNLFHAGLAVKAVSDFYDVEQKELFGRSREGKIALARQVLMYLLYAVHNASYPQIGELLERDHTTCLHGVKKIGEMMAKDQIFREEVESIAWLIRTEIADPTWDKS